MSTDNEPIELTEADYSVISTDFSPEREKELADQGIILNYKIVSGPIDPRSDNDRILAHYQTGRAKYHLDNLLMPLICDAVQRPSTDVSGHPAVRYTLTALAGFMVSGKAPN